MPSSVSRSERTPARAGAPTPFYDQLISMIEATAQENRRVVESTELHGDAADAGHWWRIHPLIPCIAGLIVVAAVGRATLVSNLRETQPPVVTADAGAGAATEGRRLPAEPERNAAGEPAVPVAPPAQPAAAESGGAAETAPTEHRIAEAATPAAAAPASPPASEAPLSLAPVTSASSSSAPTATAAPAPGPVAEPATVAPPSLPPVETGSTVRRAGNPPALGTALIVSDVKLRAGPGKGEAVLGTVPRGRSVEVVSCRGWCEVIYNGQRGWIYKSFLGR